MMIPLLISWIEPWGSRHRTHLINLSRTFRHFIERASTKERLKMEFKILMDDLDATRSLPRIRRRTMKRDISMDRELPRGGFFASNQNCISHDYHSRIFSIFLCHQSGRASTVIKHFQVLNDNNKMRRNMIEIRLHRPSEECSQLILFSYFKSWVWFKKSVFKSWFVQL